jgi:hypothetical protein
VRDGLGLLEDGVLDMLARPRAGVAGSGVKGGEVERRVEVRAGD